MAFVNDILDPWERVLIDIQWPSDYSAVVSNGHIFLKYVASAPTVST